ncbi:MAG: helix-turn-helix transcriptional regulator [Actinomycetota bacterium]|nr:helix-turn-helix transcriptional regulator [Actinomycetota bacterium]
MTQELPDWPLGPEIQRAREELGLAKREAARRAGVSDTLWRTLERGFELRQGIKFRASPRPETVAKAARVVNYPVDVAWRLAGIDVPENDTEAGETDLSKISDDDLLSEVRRRMRVDATKKPKKNGR